jgi:hypothetical protein
MPPKCDTKKSKIPDIPWTEDNNWLIWFLLTKIEKHVNYKVLFGKKEKDEVKLLLHGPLCTLIFPQNTSGETKVMVHKRIRQVLLPNLFSVDPNVVADHIKGKLES